MKKLIYFGLAFLFSFIVLNTFAFDGEAKCDLKNSNCCKIIGKEDSSGALIYVENMESL